MANPVQLIKTSHPVRANRSTDFASTCLLPELAIIRTKLLHWSLPLFNYPKKQSSNYIRYFQLLAIAYSKNMYKETTDLRIPVERT